MQRATPLISTRPAWRIPGRPIREQPPRPSSRRTPVTNPYHADEPRPLPPLSHGSTHCAFPGSTPRAAHRSPRRVLNRRTTRRFTAGTPDRIRRPTMRATAPRPSEPTVHQWNESAPDLLRNPSCGPTSHLGSPATQTRSKPTGRPAARLIRQPAVGMIRPTAPTRPTAPPLPPRLRKEHGRHRRARPSRRSQAPALLPNGPTTPRPLGEKSPHTSSGAAPHHAPP